VNVVGESASLRIEGIFTPSMRENSGLSASLCSRLSAPVREILVIMKTILLTIFSFAALTLPAMAQKGGVAILDIDEVARQLGVEEKVRVELLNMQNNLNADLQRTQTTMQNQMSGVEKAAGETPTEEQQKQIFATNQQLNEEFNRIKSRAQQTLVEERVRMINEFRSRLEPIALKAAEAQGLEVVLMKVTPPVFAYATSVDITQATTKLALDAGMQVTAPAETAPVAAPANGNTTAPAPADGAKSKGGAKENGKAKAE
jgi:Skp family chaperone for outer membrane proteins